MLLQTEIIRKKRNAQELDLEEIDFLIQSYTRGDIPDYQMAAWLMAVFFNGMTEKETFGLTKSMIHSGITVDFSNIPKFKVDKHSTGGVGDKTSLILGPIVAAAGIPVPMISGRGLGHTGGTLDKLESIPGFNTQLSLEQFIAAIETHNIAFIGQTKEICPADKKLYALRDVTATVDCIPLICASIMSKKLAEGIDGLVLDVKFGSGAFMKKTKDAAVLAKYLMKIAKRYGKKISAFLTSMNQPLGRYAGNSLEVFECLEIMKGKTHINKYGYDSYHDTRELSLILASEMMFLSGKYKSRDKSLAHAKEILESGKAWEKFKELCVLHTGNIDKLPLPTRSLEVKTTKKGFIHSFDVEKIGLAAIKVRAGRKIKEDVIEGTAGIEFHCKIGDLVQKGDTIFTIHGDNQELFQHALPDLQASFVVKSSKIKKDRLVLNHLT
ncbi:MAG: thymidine phosphorylase [Bdellovibrionaceae bacterium]|nr:thymidine phosphorylase [Pseudobdellovibrionaceae bacterium]